MTWHPVLPPVLLVAVAILLVTAQAIALRRWYMSSRDRNGLWRWLGVTAAAVLLLIAGARPVIAPDEQAAIRSAGGDQPNVFVLLDRSPNMAVQDIDGRARMELARDDVKALIDRYPLARFTIISFAADPALDWPLSADTWSLRPVLDGADPYAYGRDAVTQANAGAANTVLRYQLISAGAQFPRAENLVFYLGAGAPESRLPAREFDLPPDSVDGGAVLGYGTQAGGPVPGTDIARSPIDDVALRAVADQVGVAFIARADAAPLAAVLPEASEPSPEQTPVAAARRQTETYWLPLSAAAALILIEMYLVLKTFRRSKIADSGGLP